jgi:3-hydroxybutyryl-CoA dehydratase
MVSLSDEVIEEFEVTDDMVQAFAEATGDKNPLHLDDEYAKKTIFGRRIAHGMLGASLISCILGTKLPGKGTIYKSQKLKFVRPIYVGDRITVKVRVMGMKPTVLPNGKLPVMASTVMLKTNCYNERMEKVIVGTAEVLV